jgi:hypothetical protein
MKAMNIQLDEPTRGPVDELIAATEHKRQLKEELAAVNKFIRDVTPIVLEKFQAEGTQSLNRDGNTVYLKRNFFVKPMISKPDLVEALQECGYEDMVYPTYDARRLASFIKELDESGEEIPRELLEAIDTTEEYTVVCRKS